MERERFEQILRETVEQAVRACRTCAIRNKCMEEVAKARIVEKSLKKEIPWCAHASQAWALAFIESSKYGGDVAKLAEKIAAGKNHDQVTAGDLMLAFARMLERNAEAKG